MTRPGSAASAAVLLVLIAASAAASGVWNTRAGTYYESFADLTDMEFIQAVVRDPVEDAVCVALDWRLEQPAALAGGTPIPFSSAGSATDFAMVSEEGEYGEEVTLYQKWFSAADNMIWDDACAFGEDQGDVKKCAIFPVNDETSREGTVLLAPSVLEFNDCHYPDPQAPIMPCAQAFQLAPEMKDNPPSPGAPDLVELYMHKRNYKDILIAGRFFNVTWWVRSTDEHAVPPPNKTPNRRLVGMRIDFSHTTEGGFPQHNNYLGGATDGNVTQEPLSGCVAQPSAGCPIRVSLHNNADFNNTARLYLPEWRAWTPFSFNFCIGNMWQFNANQDPILVRCNTCEENDTQRANYDLCKEEPEGVLGMFLTTKGTTRSSNNDADTCPDVDPEVELVNCRANASLYIDGMMLTAGEGAYLAPIFDGLSPCTEWATLYWEAGLNPEPPLSSNFRTPLSFNWDVEASDPAGLAAGSLGVYASAFAESGHIELSATTIGRYFRYRSQFVSWGNNPDNPPPKPGSTRFHETCLRYEPEFDGSITPALKMVAVAYRPFAGQLVSKPIAPENLDRWESIEFGAEPGGGGVRVDILGENMVPAVTKDGVVLTDVASGTMLTRLDPGSYPSVRVRCVLDRQCDFGNRPQMEWFRLKYGPMQEMLSVNRNAVRLSRGQSVDIRFMTETTGMVEVSIYDMAGQRVLRLFHGEAKGGEIMQRGWRGTSRDGHEVAPGVYFVTVVTPTASQTKRLAVMR